MMSPNKVAILTRERDVLSVVLRKYCKLRLSGWICDCQPQGV